MAGQTATAADGTHPTGMHSCLAKCLPKIIWIERGGGVFLAFTDNDLDTSLCKNAFQ